MPVKLFLRRSGDESLFNNYLNRLIRYDKGDSVLLCSGYVQEEDSYSILTDNLLKSLKVGCSNGKVIVVGYCEGSADCPGKWRTNFSRFVRRLEDEKLKVQAFKPYKRNNWHAKIAMRLQNTTPIAALMGSSNLTRAAYGFGERQQYWNHECDVLVYPSKERRLKSYFDAPLEIVDRQLEDFGILDLVLDPKKKQRNEVEQLSWLYNEIMKSVTEFRVSDDLDKHSLFFGMR